MEKKYEGCYLLKADMSEEEVEKEAAFIEKSIAGAGGRLVKKELLGRRDLAYPVKKNTEAIYYAFYFTALPDQIAPIRESFVRRDNILRYIIVQRKRLPKEEEEKNGGAESK